MGAGGLASSGGTNGRPAAERAFTCGMCAILVIYVCVWLARQSRKVWPTTMTWPTAKRMRADHRRGLDGVRASGHALHGPQGLQVCPGAGPVVAFACGTS